MVLYAADGEPEPLERLSMSDRAKPLVSVIMPAYNGERYIRRAIESVRRQTMSDWELVVVDDGSTDSTRAIVSRWARVDHRVKLINQPNRGPSAARNRSIEAAQGSLIAYLDCDDEYHPDYLGLVVTHQSEDVIQVFNYEIFDERPWSPTFGRLWVWQPGRHAKHFPAKNVFVPLGAAHHHRWLDEVGGFDESLSLDEDTDLWRRFADAGARFQFHDLLSGLYHLRLSSQSRKPHSPPSSTAHAMGPAASSAAISENCN